MDQTGVELTKDLFDTHIDVKTRETWLITRFTWTNKNNVSVQLITYGATITSIKLPSTSGAVDDIVMGFDKLKGYLDSANPYFGATIGRVANRVGKAKIKIGMNSYEVSANLGQHQLHGGFKGFDKKNWIFHVDGTKVILSCLSEDMEEGYPGDVLVNATFELTNDNEFLVDYKATATRPTFVNMTNHSYFNLAGHHTGAEELYKHKISINADQTTDVDTDSIPSGKLLPVENTIFDLRIPKTLGDVIDKIPGYDGYDHNFCITKGSQQGNTFVAMVEHQPTGRTLEVYSNQPGVQFYTTNGFPHQGLEGKGGSVYKKHGALCLETQNWPDAINHTNFPPAVLYPGKTYHHTFAYKFSVN